MNLPAEFTDAIIEGRNMSAQGRFLDAERIYRALAAPGPHRRIALEALAELYLHQQRQEEARNVLQELAEEDPDNLHYSASLANFLDMAGETQPAIEEYQRFIARQPDEAIAHFNLALLLKKQHQYEDAAAACHEAIKLGIDQPEEVFFHLGELYSEMQDVEKFEEMTERALRLAPDYVPALFNKASHFEQSGEKRLAIRHYEKILSIDPKHWKSLMRLAYPGKVTAEDHRLIERLKSSVDEAEDDPFSQEGLYFALGKSYNDLESYDEAAAAYAAANELSRQRVLPYTPAATEQAFDRIIELFDSDWIENSSPDVDGSPVFICGMYRSGSTLLERMLGAHPAIAAAGELTDLGRLFISNVGPFPQAAESASKEQLETVAKEYAAMVRERFPDSALVTDKQPNNFLLVGLIQSMFRGSKILRTRRNILDNALSVYFQQFDRASSYANDLHNIVHYYQQQERLFEHWESVAGDNICTVDYEELVESPEAVLRRVLAFLGLEWDDNVLNFQDSGGLVKTASIWQVRQGLYSGSRGRWRNYESLLGDLTDLAPS